MIRGRRFVLVAPFMNTFPACSILVRGGISGVPRGIDRDHVTTSTDRYGSSYPCTANCGGGNCIVGRVLMCAVGG